MTCAYCGWMGDAVEYYATLHHQRLEPAVEKLQDLGHICRDPNKIRPLLRRYLVQRENDRGAVQAWRTRSRFSHIRQATPRQCEILAHWGARDMLNESWDQQLHRMIGVSDKGDIRSTFGISGNLAGKDSQPYLISPLCAVPSMPTGFVGFTTLQNEKQFYAVEREGCSLDALMLLGLGSMFEERLYAFDDLAMALTLQIWNQHDMRNPLPVVGYTKDTYRAWQHYQSSDIIFAMPQFSFDVIRAALRVFDRAYISTEPKFDVLEDPLVVLSGHNAADFLERMDRHRRPLPEAICDWFREASAGEIREFGRRIEFEPRHWLRILKCVDKSREPDLYSKLMSFQDSGTFELRVPLVSKGRSVVGDLIERADGLYVGSHCPCPAVVSLDTVTSFGTTSTLQGTVQIEGDVFSFDIPSDMFSAAWVEKFAGENGHYLKIASNIRSDFEHYIRSLHPPKRVEGLDAVGWHAKKCGFVFPRYSIGSGGRIEPTRIPLAQQHPTENLGPEYRIPKEQIAPLLADKPENSVLWAMMAALTASIIAHAENHSTLGIALCSGSRSRRRRALDLLLDIGCVPQVKPADLRAEEHRNRYPVGAWLEAEDTVLKWVYNKPGSKAVPMHLRRNAIVTMDETLVRAATLAGGFVFIDVDTEELPDPLALKNLLARILVWYQEHGRSLSYAKQAPAADNHLIHGVLRMLRTRIESTYQRQFTAALRSAADRVHVDENSGPGAVGRRFLYAVHYLIDGLKLPLDLNLDNPMRTKGVAVQADRVFLSRPNIVKALKNVAKYGLPGTQQITDAFEDDGALIQTVAGLQELEGWELTRAYWDSTRAAWARLRV